MFKATLLLMSLNTEVHTDFLYATKHITHKTVKKSEQSLHNNICTFSHIWLSFHIYACAYTHTLKLDEIPKLTWVILYF